jgi:predicted amidophosphoribosyltransferase
MRDRHFPRICANCQAPMARQEDSCWACGTPWPVRERRPVGAVTMTSARFTPAELETSRMAATERWTNEGGSVRPDPAPAHLLVEEECAS